VTSLEILLLLFFAAAVFAAGVFARRLKAQQRHHAAELDEQRARRDAELREQAQRTAALFDRMIEGLIVVDGAGRIRLANRAVGEMFGFEGPATGRTVLEATRHHEVAAVVTRLDLAPEVLGHELRLDGVSTTRFFQVNALALREAGGARDGAILVFHDLTRLRQLESVRQEFVANVSHELRTPLSLIKSAAETLLDGGKNDPAALTRFLEIIDKHANRLTLLIDDLLLLSTLDSGQMRLNLQPLSLRGAAQDALEDFGPRASARGVLLENEVPPALIARADPDRLRQVLANLLDNAIKYGRTDGRVTMSGRALPDGRVEISVRDDGPGLAPEASARVFERFYRADKARSREQGGTGLGLAIVKHVVQAHGGEVRVESAPGKGAVFFITLLAAQVS
jgi:two-component system, OmpR family, phosphate regulon sensor histidine kinase PhoR